MRMRITKAPLYVFPTLAILLILLVPLLIPLSGCSTNSDGQDGGTGISDDFTFDPSAGLDDNGFWIGVRALDYVTVPNYRAISIPSSVHQISDDDVQQEIGVILADFPGGGQIMDRAVVDGDTVNIDYVGSVNGVEFENGSTDGMGTVVIIGVTNYIDGFLEQLIGHMPGDTFNLHVTFPANYHEASLKGKDAVFVTTVNYIVEDASVGLTDAFVAENLTAYYGWSTVSEMEDGVRSVLRTQSIMRYIEQYFSNEVAVSSVPESLTQYQVNAMLDHFHRNASYNGMELIAFLDEYEGVSSVDALIDLYRYNNLESATFYLVVQAIAEDAGIAVSEEDLANYIGETSVYAYEEQYGRPYTKHQVLCQMILDYVVENAVFA